MKAKTKRVVTAKLSVVMQQTKLMPQTPTAADVTKEKNN